MSGMHQGISFGSHSARRQLSCSHAQSCSCNGADRPSFAILPATCCLSLTMQLQQNGNWIECIALMGCIISCSLQTYTIGACRPCLYISSLRRMHHNLHLRACQTLKQFSWREGQVGLASQRSLCWCQAQARHWPLLAGM